MPEKSSGFESPLPWSILMHQVELEVLEAYQGDLPAVCVRCGEPASVYRNKTLSTLPLGMPFLPLVWFFVYAGKVWVRLPFCVKHRNHFRNHLILRYLGFVIVFVVGIISLLATVSGSGFMCPLGLGVALAYLVLCAVKRYRGVYLVAYNERATVLGGVCLEFVEAVREKHAKQQQILNRLSPADPYEPKRRSDSDERFHA